MRSKIKALISEIVFDEVVKHVSKLGLNKRKVIKEIQSIFDIYMAPDLINLKYEKLAIDMGDIHPLTSSEELNVDCLVSLDKKHILVLADKIKKFQIVSPGKLIEIIYGHKKEQSP